MLRINYIKLYCKICIPINNDIKSTLVKHFDIQPTSKYYYFTTTRFAIRIIF